MKKVLTAVMLAGACGLLFLYPHAAATGASMGLSLCGTVIIPSLLPFLTLCGTCMRLSLADTVGRWLARPTAWLFRLPACCGLPLLLSVAGGYPAGAAAVARLLEEGQISERDAARMLHFCVNAGPAFAVSAVGGAMLGDLRVGWILLAAHLTAALLIGVTEARFAPRPQTRTIPRRRSMPLAAAFTQAVRESAVTLLYACGFVVLFAVVQGIADGSGVSGWLSRLFARVPACQALPIGLLEVGCGCVQATGQREPSMFVLGCLLGFGGLSVHCQVRALVAAYPAALSGFFSRRVLHGVLGGVLSALLCRIIPLSVHTLAPGAAAVKWFTVSPLLSLVLLAMCCCFLWNSEKKIVKRREM